LKCIRGDGQIKASAKLLWTILLKDNDAGYKYDKTKYEGFPIEEDLDKNYRYYYNRIKPPGFMVYARDTVVLLTWKENEDGSIWMYGASALHEKAPEVKGVVRANIIIWSWILTPTKEDPSVTDVTYILQTDPAGWVPTTVTNVFATD